MSGNITIKSRAVPSKPRSENYPIGAVVAPSGGGGSTTIVSGGGPGVDIVRVGDTKTLTDKNVLSSLRTIAEILTRIVKIGGTEELSEENTLSSLRIRSELKEAIDSLKDLYLSKTSPDETSFLIKLLGGLLVNNGITTDTLTSTNATMRILEVLESLTAKTGSFSGGLTADDTTTRILNVLESLTAGSGSFSGDVSSSDYAANSTGWRIGRAGMIEADKAILRSLMEVPEILASKKVTTLNLLVQAIAEIRDLSVSHVATLMGTVVKDYVSSETFVSGLAGEGMKIYKALDGKWSMEIDNLTVRNLFYVFELVVQRAVHQGGMVIRSAAGGKLTKVTDGGTYWRCEHDSADAFVKDDQVLCQTFTGAAVKRYWRLVTSAGAGYFNLSKTDCEAGSAVPEAGDEVSVLGNRTDAARQKAQIDCAVGDTAPYRDDYAGINSYSLTDRLITRTGELSGITDSVFGALSGSGFYGTNVWLKGTFVLHSGKTVEGEIAGAIGDLEIGGRNLLADTGSFSEWKSMNGATILSDTYQGLAIANQVGPWSRLERDYSFEAGQTYSLSAFVRSTTGGTTLYASVPGNSREIRRNLSTEWMRVSHTFTVAEGIVSPAYFVIPVDNASTGALQVCGYKLEKGGKATDWTPAPEDVENRITTVETNFEIREGQISSKVSEATTSALNAKNSETSAAGSASTATAKAGEAANSAGSAAASLRSVTTKESAITQTASKISLQVTEVTDKTNTAKNAAELATAMSQGRMLYRDPTFSKGRNGTKPYGSGSVQTVEEVPGCPNSHGRALKIVATEWNSPSFPVVAGFYFGNMSRANAVFIVRIIANIPVGRQIQAYHNRFGVGAWTKWLTSNAGTGKWQEYAYKVVCGYSDPFSTVNHFALEKGEAPTVAAPVTWYVSYATVFDVTDAEIDYIADAEDKYPTKTELSSGIKVLSDKIELRVSKDDFNALGTRVSSAETRITQTEKSISLKADQTTVDGLDTRLQSAEVNIQPDQIKMVVKEQTKEIAKAAAVDAAKRTETSIDAKALDENKYYPVIIQLYTTKPYIITVERTLNASYGKPSWSTHGGGFAVICRWQSNGSGWGTIDVKRTIMEYTYRFSNVDPVGSIGQIEQASLEYIYVRGGSKYNVIVEGATGVPILLKKADYTWSAYGSTVTLPLKTSVEKPEVNLATTEMIKSGINIDEFGVSVFGKKIDFSGKVTFNSLNPSLQGTINDKVNTSTIIDGGKIKTSMIDAQAIVTNAFSAQDAKINVLGTSELFIGNLNGTQGWTMKGGSIKHNVTGVELTADGKISLPSTGAMMVGDRTFITNGKIATDFIDTGKLTATTGAKIGGFKVSDYNLSNMDNRDCWITVDYVNGSIRRTSSLGNNWPATLGYTTAGYFSSTGHDENRALSLRASGSVMTQWGGGYTNLAIDAVGGVKWKMGASDYWCMPGVLWAGIIDSMGNIQRQWGKGAGSVYCRRTGRGEYEIRDSLGHGDHFIFGNVIGDWGFVQTWAIDPGICRVRTIHANNFTIDVWFEVMLVGRSLN